MCCCAPIRGIKCVTMILTSISSIHFLVLHPPIFAHGITKVWEDLRKNGKNSTIQVCLKGSNAIDEAQTARSWRTTRPILQAMLQYHHLEVLRDRRGRQVKWVNFFGVGGHNIFRFEIGSGRSVLVVDLDIDLNKLNLIPPLQYILYIELC